MIDDNKNNSEYTRGILTNRLYNMFSNPGVSSKTALRAGIREKGIVIACCLIFFLILVATVSGTSQSQMQSTFHLTPEGEESYDASPEERERSIYDKDAARKDTEDLLMIISEAKAKNRLDVISELKRAIKAGGWDVGRSMEVMTETGSSYSASGFVYSMSDARVLAAFSISLGNGQIIKTGSGSYVSQSGLPVKVRIKGREIDYRETLRSALDDYLAVGTFYETDFEMQDGKIKVYDDPETVYEDNFVTDPETGETVNIPIKKAVHHYYVHPILNEKNISEMAEEIFFLDVDAPYEGFTIGEINVREAIDRISEGTQAVLFGEAGTSSLFYFTGFDGAYEWPVPGNYRITSRYGYRVHPISGKYSKHSGVDIAGLTGSPVVAADDGYVDYTGYGSSYGNNIRIMHESGTMSVYAHLSVIGVSRGDTVKRGQQIGLIGSTGNSTGPHLHFEIRVNGQAADPLPLICSEESDLDLEKEEGNT